MAKTFLDIGSTIGDVVDLPAFMAAITGDVAFGDEFVGTVVEDEHIGVGSYTTSNIFNAKHRVTAAANVRHDGSGQRGGARIVFTGNGYPFNIQSNDLIIEDLMIEQAGTQGGRSCIFLGVAGVHRTIIRRNAIVLSTDAIDNIAINLAVHDQEDIEIYLNNLFWSAANSAAYLFQPFRRMVRGLITCNTLVKDDDIAVAGLMRVWATPADAPILRGNLGVAVTNPSVAEITAVGDAGSTKNAGSDDKNGYGGANPIDIETDLLKTPADLLENTKIATIDLRRKVVNHDLGPLSPQLIGIDLTAVIGNIDVTGNEFNPGIDTVIMGAHQIALVVPTGRGFKSRFKDRRFLMTET